MSIEDFQRNVTRAHAAASALAAFCKGLFPGAKIWHVRCVLASFIMLVCFTSMHHVAHAGTLGDLQSSFGQGSAGIAERALNTASIIFGVLAALAITMAALGHYIHHQYSIEGFAGQFFYYLANLAIPWLILRSAYGVIPKIMNLLVPVAEDISGYSSASPDDVWQSMANVASEMLKASVHLPQTGGLVNSVVNDVTTPIITFMAAALFMIAAAALVAELILTWVFGYIVLSAGAVQLGWSAAAGTAGFTMGYWRAVIGVAMRLVVILVVVHFAQVQSIQWVSWIKAPDDNDTSMALLEVLGSAMIYLRIVWATPQYASSTVSGDAGATSGGEFVETVGRKVGTAGAM